MEIDKAMTLDEYIDTLTEEEKVKYKDLIDECRVRDKEIQENGRKIEQGLRAIMDDAIGRLVEPYLDWDGLKS